jgi:hypothetical protein
MRIALLTILCLTVSAIPALAAVGYDNGRGNGTTDAWTINFGYVVSNDFSTGPEGTGMNLVIGFSLNTWEFPGDSLSSLDFSITDSENAPCPSELCLGSGTVSKNAMTLNDAFISTNQFGYNFDLVSANLSFNSVSVPEGVRLWLNLYNAVVPSGDPVYWDENSGAGCGGYQGNGDCPSSASESAVGTIPSEAFTIVGQQSSGGTTPEPSSIMLLGSGILGLAGLMRRKLF